MDTLPKNIMAFLDEQYQAISATTSDLSPEVRLSIVMCFLTNRLNEDFGSKFVDAFFLIADWDRDRYGLLE